jgi:hypothetical protein
LSGSGRGTIAIAVGRVAQADARSTPILWNEVETCSLEGLYQSAIIHSLQPSSLIFDLECANC